MLQFTMKVALISASGALTPGPLTAAAAAIGARRGWLGGLLVSLGHMIVELPLVILIAFGLFSFLNEGLVKFLSVLGGTTLLIFAYLTARSSAKFEKKETDRSPILIGVIFTALNPFFLVWWATVGAALVAESIVLYSNSGIVIFYTSHVWLDFLWLTFVAGISSFSSRILTIYRAFLMFLAILVALFGIDFLLYGLFGKKFLSF